MVKEGPCQWGHTFRNLTNLSRIVTTVKYVRTNFSVFYFATMVCLERMLSSSPTLLSMSHKMVCARKLKPPGHMADPVWSNSPNNGGVAFCFPLIGQGIRLGYLMPPYGLDELFGGTGHRLTSSCHRPWHLPSMISLHYCPQSLKKNRTMLLIIHVHVIVLVTGNRWHATFK